MKTTASIQVNSTAEASASGTSASVTYDNSLTAEAGVRVGTDDLGTGVGVSAKTGTVAGASAGLDGNNVFVEAFYSDTTEAHLTADATAKIKGVGGSASIDAYAKTGTEMELHAQVGQSGVAAGAEASIGNAVGVDAEGTVALRGIEATGGAGVSIGEHLEAGGSAEATFKNGKATVAVAGDVAALIGVEADVKVTVDTKKVVADAVAVADAGQTAANTVVSTATSVAKDAGNAMKKAGNGIKKAFKF